MTAKEKVMAERNDAEFLKHPEWWPNLVCPVKNHRLSVAGTLPVCGLFFAGTTYVKELNMWRSWTPAEFDAAKTWNYDSVEDAVADGWMVD